MSVEGEVSVQASIHSEGSDSSSGPTKIVMPSTKLSYTRIEPLDDANWFAWKFQFGFVLKALGLGAAAEADCSKEVDEQALACLVLNVKLHHHSLLKKVTTFKEGMAALENMYKIKGKASRLLLLKNLQQLEKDEMESMTRYVGRVRELRDELEAAGDEVSETQLVLAMLNGLQDYDTYAAIIASDPKELTLEGAVVILLQAEKHKLGLMSIKEERGAAFTTSHRKKFSKQHDAEMVCYYCGQRGHKKSDCVNKAHDEATAKQRYAKKDGQARHPII